MSVPHLHLSNFRLKGRPPHDALTLPLTHKRNPLYSGSKKGASYHLTSPKFWGKNIGIVTDGDSGVMEESNTQVRQQGILSGT
jgi:hypothetical protein